jgi:hypothetical protein
MKTLSRTFRFIVLGVIVTVVVVSCCNFPFPSVLDTTSYAYLELGHESRGIAQTRTYVEWKNKDEFDTAMDQVRGHNGKYCLCVLMPGGTPYPYPSNNDCSRYNCPSPKNVRTVRVTKSKAADHIAAGESAVNDPHVTYRIQSPYPGDIIKVLNTLQ